MNKKTVLGVLSAISILTMSVSPVFASVDLPATASSKADTAISLTPQQAQDLRHLNSPAVVQGIREKLKHLPTLTVAPGSTVTKTYNVDGFKLVYSSTNVASGDPISTASVSISLYDSVGIFLWTATYRDVFYWTGSSLSPSPPQIEWSPASWLFLWSYYAGTPSVTNWGTEAYSFDSGDAKLQLTQYGTIQDWQINGYAYMYDNGYWKAHISD